MTEAAPVALVRVELIAPALPADVLPDEAALRRRARYVAGVEYLAQALGAMQPLSWEGDAVTLVLGGRAAPDLPVEAYLAAQEIWQRTRIALELDARIAAHVAFVARGPQGIAEHAGEMRALLDLARPGMIVVSEDVALGLPLDFQQDLAPVGMAVGAPAHAFPKGSTPPGPANELPEDEALWSAMRAYARSLEIRLLRYPGVHLGQRPPRLDVREVFVAPTFAILPEERRDHPGRPGRGRRPPRALADGAMHRHRLALRDLVRGHRRLVLLGDPGSGKSTLLRWLAVVAAGGKFACAEAIWLSERLMPILVSLGRLAEVLHAQEEEPASLLARYLHDRGLGEETWLNAMLARALEGGRCLLLLDGLDEAKPDDRAALRRWIEALVAAYPQTRLVVSSRLVGYPGLSLPDRTDVTLEPFGTSQIESASRALLTALARRDTDGVPASIDSHTKALLSAIHAIPGLERLATNPFALATLTLIHRAEGKLPRHRVQAYEVFARALCETWGEARRLVAGEEPAAAIAYQEEALPILGQLALAMHEEHPDGLAPEAFVRETVARALEEQRGLAAGEGERAAHEFLRRATEEVQILAERGPGVWGFLHLTFQEFFAAAGLHAAERFEEIALTRLFDPRWEEVLRLGVGYLAIVQRRPVAARRFVERVLAWTEPQPRAWVTEILRLQVPMATLLAAEAGDALPEPAQERIAQAFAGWAVDPPTDSAPGRYLDKLRPTDLYRQVALALTSHVEKDGALYLRADHERLGWDILPHAAQGAPDAMDRLLQSPSPGVRAAAVYGLIRAVDDPDHYVRWALEQQTAEVRHAALIVLYDHCPGGFYSPSSYDLVLDASRDESPVVRSSAVSVLGAMYVDQQDADVEQRLEELARHDRDIAVRGEAALALAIMRCDNGDVALALRLLEEPALPEAMRSRISRAMQDMEVDVDEWLLTGLRSSDELRRATALQLGVFNSSDVVRRLIPSVMRDLSPAVREKALLALPPTREVEKDQRHEIKRQVQAALTDTAPEVRSAALHAAASGWLSSRETQDALHGALGDASAEVRCSAVKELSRSRSSRRAEEALLRALDDVDESVALEATVSLVRMGVSEAIPRLVDLAPSSAAARRALWSLATGREA